MMVRTGLATVLQANGFEVVSDVPDGEQAVIAYEHHKPDVVLMDLIMPRLDGVGAIKAIRARDPQARIVALTSFDSDELVQNALQAGAIGFLMKNISADDLCKAIKNAASGRRTLAPEAADALLRSMNKSPEVGSDLTERERQILGLMVDGLNNSQIAEKIFLSPSTIKFHVSAILSKLGVTNRVEAVALSVKHDIIKRGA